MVQADEKLIVAVDGGGSTCRVSICRFDGKVLGKARGGPANISTDFEGAYKNITDTIHRAYGAIGLPTTRKVNDFAYLGLAGANIAGVAKQMEGRLNFQGVTVTTDLETTVQGAMGDGDGTVAAIGTGSVYFRRKGRDTRHAGGWGFRIGDESGGANLGQMLLRRTLHACDGLISQSSLTQAVLEQFDGLPKNIAAFSLTASPMDFGKFVPQIVKSMRAADPVAVGILNDAVDHLEKTLDALEAADTGAIYLAGGLGPIYKSLLRVDYQKICAQPQAPAIAGAIALARQKWDDQTARNPENELIPQHG